MREDTRGYIEKSIDEMLEQEDLLCDIQWIDKEIPISSMRELALGYVIGAIEFVAKSIILLSESKAEIGENKEGEIIGLMIKRRLPEIVDCIEKAINK
jgi:hypothetical protein